MTGDSQILGEILEVIRRAKTICIVGHVRPDGDCIGSQVGLALALQNHGKQVTVWNEDPVPQKLRWMVPSGMVKKPEAGHTFDLVIATDCASFERLGTAGKFTAKHRDFINIDHHVSNTRYAKLNWVSARVPATGELIYELLKHAGWPVTPAIADCLFTAISTDTGSFGYPSTTPGTYHVAADLVRHGANLARVCNEVYQSYPMSRAKLLRHVFNSFRTTHDDQIAWFWLRKRDYTRTGADTNDSEGLIDHIRDIEPVVVACVFEEVEPELTRISLRSKSERVNVNEVAGKFGGGGHPAAAGARIPGNPLSVQRKVIAAIKKALDAPK